MGWDLGGDGYFPAYVAVSALASFTLTLLLVGLWIRVARSTGILSRDLNKPGRLMVADSGGIWVIFSVAVSFMLFEALYIYISGSTYRFQEVSSIIMVLLLASIVGAIDDFAGWKKGLKHYYRVALTLPISLPLVVVKAGVTTMDIPLVGRVDLGLAYPLILVPLGIVGASNGFNMLAGYNGLEAGMGLLLMLFTVIYAAREGLDLTLAAATIMASGVLAFLYYNRYPSRVFPGNAFTYGLGAFYASLVIIDDFQKFGVTLFLLYFIELALFLRGLLNGVYKENFARVEADGSLREPYDKVYSVTHLSIKLLKTLKGRAWEWEVTALILGAQAVVGLIALTAF